MLKGLLGDKILCNESLPCLLFKCGIIQRLTLGVISEDGFTTKTNAETIIQTGKNRKTENDLFPSRFIPVFVFTSLNFS